MIFFYIFLVKTAPTVRVSYLSLSLPSLALGISLYLSPVRGLILLVNSCKLLLKKSRRALFCWEILYKTLILSAYYKKLFSI